jgi:hypothetical protein
MRMKKSGITMAVLAAVLLCFGLGAGVFAQEVKPSEPAGPASALRVFLDGDMPGSDYIKTEIQFVQYVRDRKDADVHVLSTSIYSGAGSEYRIEFIGLNSYQDIHFTLKCFSDRLSTEDENRIGFVRVLKQGLAPFAARTEAGNRLAISYTPPAADRPAVALRDPWDSWIFGFNLSGSISGEESYGSNNWRSGFSVNRVTEKVKISASLNTSANNSRYTVLDEEIKNSTRNWSVSGLAVWSLGDHWSLGASTAASSSTYSNVKTSFRFSPALEFNLFPYAESTRKQLTFLYRLTFGRISYLEETIFDKTAESLLSQSLSISLDVTQPWGSASASVVGSHYFHDLSKNRLSFYGYFSVRVWKGFSVNANGGFAMIHDQLSLVKSGLTEDEIFLRLKQMSTTFEYYISLGVGFSFGSKMSRAVNPRMQGGDHY